MQPEDGLVELITTLNVGVPVAVGVLVGVIVIVGVLPPGVLVDVLVAVFVGAAQLVEKAMLA